MTLYTLPIAHHDGVDFVPILAADLDDELELLSRGGMHTFFMRGPFDSDSALTWKQVKEMYA